MSGTSLVLSGNITANNITATGQEIVGNLSTTNNLRVVASSQTYYRSPKLLFTTDPAPSASTLLNNIFVFTGGSAINFTLPTVASISAYLTSIGVTFAPSLSCTVQLANSASSNVAVNVVPGTGMVTTVISENGLSIGQNRNKYLTIIFASTSTADLLV